MLAGSMHGRSETVALVPRTQRHCRDAEPTSDFTGGESMRSGSQAIIPSPSYGQFGGDIVRLVILRDHQPGRPKWIRAAEPRRIPSHSVSRPSSSRPHRRFVGPPNPTYRRVRSCVDYRIDWMVRMERFRASTYALVV
jgi:hypothetical protein